ncbi:hypothetical protein SAMN04489735_104536 [Aneurinibacillus thermoaerophilus]|uniref:Uncharacterized protein n=1 Tax=Aneurinibacillus thermoaerophilus TaxID=143495 RepID=A0A1G8ELL4_ANETH|nr:hypothetical protein [Aneurinibacillus thermoaerophilus]QYY44740.1 hypothetical protein K3F53_19035 [Aneurinibacillus thermoaerophilus]SDH70795.1 hypothetical protein SAMN04489735_104536 [Aneurinibacillus thermoaerophilus]
MKSSCICGGTGIVSDERAYGVMFKPCYCEAAEELQRKVNAELAEMLVNIRDKKRKQSA